MRLRSDELRSRLAAEFALGTMHGKARKRFERMMDDDDRLQALVDQWQRQINQLGGALAPQRPPERVWKAIKADIEPLTQSRPRQGGWWASLGFWRFTTAAATLAAVFVASVWWYQPGREAPTVSVAVLNNQQSQSAWLVASQPRQNQIRVKTVTDQSIGQDKDFELWLLPGQQQPPISLGLITAKGEVVIQLSPRLMERITRAAALAVSLEPKGGSPTGQPTGPVLYQGKLTTL